MTDKRLKTIVIGYRNLPQLDRGQDEWYVRRVQVRLEGGVRPRREARVAGTRLNGLGERSGTVPVRTAMSMRHSGQHAHGDGAELDRRSLCFEAVEPDGGQDRRLHRGCGLRTAGCGIA